MNHFDSRKADAMGRLKLMPCHTARQSRVHCVRRMVLEGPLFGQYFQKVQATNFEVASDAFQTFKDLLTRHKLLVGAYLSSHYEEVCSC